MGNICCKANASTSNGTGKGGLKTPTTQTKIENMSKGKILK
jgi:hypothetical protein